MSAPPMTLLPDTVVDKAALTGLDFDADVVCGLFTGYWVNGVLSRTDACDNAADWSITASCLRCGHRFTTAICSAHHAAIATANCLMAHNVCGPFSMHVHRMERIR